MPLTPEEQAELDSLRETQGEIAAPSVPPVPESGGGLSKAEKLELMALRKIQTPKTPEVPWYESVGRGLSQGLSLGFSDELGAALESLGSSKTYDQILEENRNLEKDASAANPWLYKGSEIAGGIVPTLPLMAASGGAAGAGKVAQALNTIKGQALTGAAIGGLTGAGYSEGENLGSDIFKGALLGGGIGGAAGVVGKGIGKVAGALRKGSKAAASEIDDVAGQVTKATDKIDDAVKQADELGAKQLDDLDELDTLLQDELDDFANDLPSHEVPDQFAAETNANHERLAKFSGKGADQADETARKISYAEKHPEIFDEGRVRLDASKKNNLERQVLVAMKKGKLRQKQYEQETGKILDGVLLDRQEILKPFQDAMNRLTKRGGGLYNQENEGAARVLLKYLNGSEGEGTEQLFKGLLDIDGPIDARMIREYIRDFRAGNVSAYTKNGQPLKIKAKELKKVAHELNSALKKAIRKKKGAQEAKAYDRMMGEYADDTTALTTLEKLFKMDRNLNPGKSNWYETDVVHRLGKVVDGHRSQNEPVTKALLHLGKRDGKDFLKTVHDNFLLDDLFPHLTSGLDGGTATRTVARGMNIVKEGGLSPTRMAKAAIKEAPGMIEGQRSKMLEAMVRNQQNAARKTGEALKATGDALRAGAKGAVKAAKGIRELGDVVGQKGQKLATRVQAAGPAVSKYAATPPSVTPAQHYVLMQRDPAYRKRWEKAQDME